MAEALPDGVVLALDVLLMLAVALGAAVTLFAPRRVTGTLAFLMLGLVLIVVWARLGAPDVALAEAAIASGVTGALLIAAVTEQPRGETDHRGRLDLAAQGLLVLLAGAAAGWAVLAAVDGPSVERPLGAAATAALDDAAVSHPVTAVLLDFRAYDTLLEIGVLAAAALVALALRGDDPWWRGTPAPGHPAPPAHAVLEQRPAVVALVRVLAPVLVLLAGWLLVAGSTRPGGAFQAGAVITGALLLAHLAGLVRLPSGGGLGAGVLGGLVAFVGVAVGTRLAGRGWLDVEAPWGGTLIVALEAVLAIGIGIALAVLFLAAGPADPAPRRRTP